MNGILRDWVPAVVDVYGGVGADCFCDAAGLGIVDEIHGLAAVDLSFDEAVFSVPCEITVRVDVSG